MMLSLFGAGAQLSQPQVSGFQNVGAGQTAASTLGIQTAQIGQQYASRGMSIPPTLEVRPGYRFVVMVTKDMVLPGPWRG
jgi:type IV secretory pathway VirB10-like protein